MARFRPYVDRGLHSSGAAQKYARLRAAEAQGKYEAALARIVELRLACERAANVLEDLGRADEAAVVRKTIDAGKAEFP